MIYLMIENISGSVIRSQVFAMLAEITQCFDRDVDLLAMERKTVWETTNRQKTLRQELRRYRVRPHIFIHYGQRHPMTYINLGRMMLTLLMLLLNNPRQTIMVRNFHSAFVTIPFGRLFSKSALVLDLRGAFVHELLLREVINKGSRLHRLLVWMERQSFESADHIICVSEKLADYVTQTAVHPGPTSVIPCAVDAHFFAPDAAKIKALRQTLNVSQKFVVIYAGSITSWNLLEPMLDIFEIVQIIHPAAHFLCLTLGVDEAQQAFKAKGWPETRYTIMTVPHREIRHYIALGDAGLLLREDNLVNRVASPVKFGEYMACGVPVCITPCIGDLPDLVAEYKVGLALNLEQPNLAATVHNFVEDVIQNRTAYRQRCQLLAKTRFKRENYLETYRQLLQPKNQGHNNV